MDYIENETSKNKTKEDAIFERVARELEEKCKQRRAHNFYAKLRKMPDFCQKLQEIAGQERNKDLTFKKVDMDLGHMQTMALDFFQTLDEELCESVWRVLEDTENTTLYVKKPNEKGTNNSVGVVTKENYYKNGKLKEKTVKIEISLEPKNDTRGLITVAHELAHTMEERVQKRMRPRIDVLGEIAPLFIEKIYADYLVKTGKIDQSERDELSLLEKYTQISDARTITEEMEILSQLPPPIKAKDLKTLDEKYQGSPRRATLLKRIKTMIYGRDGKEHYGERQLRYIIGEIVSAEVYKDFQKDPKQTIEKFKNFCENNAHISAQKGFEILLGADYEKRMGIKIGGNKRLKD